MEIMSAIRIAYINEAFPKLSETFVTQEMSALKELGTDVCSISLTHPPSAPRHTVAEQWARKTWYAADHPGRNACLLTGAALRNPVRYMRWLHHARRHGGKQALFFSPAIASRVIFQRVVHMHAHFAFDAALAAYHVSAITGIPFSLTVHAADLFVYDSTLARVAGSAAFIVTVSGFNREFIYRNIPLGNTPVYVVHCGVDVEKFRPVKRPATEVPTILCVARFIPKKGIAVLIRACAVLKRLGVPFHCKLIGNGPDYPSLLRLVAEMHLTDCIEFVGDCSQETVLEELHAAHLFALPCVIDSSGDRDGIPVSLMEAMATGLPVVSTQITGIPELIDDGSSGVLVPPGSVEALTVALRRLIEQPEVRAQLGAGGRRKVVSEFNSNTSASQLLDLFEEHSCTERTS